MPDANEISNAARWAYLRSQVPAMERTTYLNAGFIGPMSNFVAKAFRDRFDLEVSLGPTTRTVSEDRMAITTRLKEAGAKMLGCDVDELAITGNTTEGVNIGVNGVEMRPGDRVVTTNIEHGGGLMPAYRLREHGAELAFARIEAEDGPGAIVERFDEAMGDHARLVILSEISFSTTQLLPVREIVEMAHARGATVVVDGAQTAGHLPLDMHAMDVDAYAVPSHKWLCGPGGMGLLYVKRDRIPDIEPVKVSGRYAASYDYEGKFEPKRDSVLKFEVSTMSSPAAAGMAAAMEQYLESGPQAHWDYVRWLNLEAERRMASIPGVELTGARQEATRSGLFLFKLKGTDPAHLAYYMQVAGGIVCRSVKQMDSVRLSLNSYNNTADLDKVAEYVERAATKGIPEDILEAARAVAAPVEA